MLVSASLLRGMTASMVTWARLTDPDDVSARELHVQDPRTAQSRGEHSSTEMSSYSVALVRLIDTLKMIDCMVLISGMT